MTIAPLTLLLFIFIALYFGQAVFICVGLWRAHKRVKQQPVDEPFVSIIIAARNEENNIATTLTSLIQLEYPIDKYEIIVVDDNSEDKTVEIVEEIRQKHNQLKLIQMTKRIANLNGKASAIHTAMNKARGAIIFVTDADCRVPSTWIRAHLSHYTSETSMVGGFTLLTEKDKPSNLFSRVQSLEWLFVTAVGSGYSGLGIPLSIFGNNMSFRKDTYDGTGGFPKIGFSLVEDYALMNAIRKQIRSKIRLQPDPKMIVQTNSLSSLKQFYIQRKRWAIGSRSFSLWSKFILLLGIIGKVIPLILIIMQLYLSALLILFAVLFLDFFILLFAVAFLQRKDQIRSFVLYELFVMIYTLMLIPFFLFSRSVAWKDRNYQTNN